VKLKTGGRLVTPDMEFCYSFLKSLCKDFEELFVYDRQTGERVFRSLVGAIVDGTSVSAYCKDHPAVSADTVLKLGSLPLEVMVEKCNRLLKANAVLAFRSGLYRGSDSSIDHHSIVYHGRKTEYTMNTIIDGKLRTVHRYAVAGVTGHRRFLALSVQPCKKGVPSHVLVHKLLRDIPSGFDPVLMDKYFCSADVYREFEKNGRGFLTPYKINGRIDEMYLQSLHDGETVKPYRLRGRQGGWVTVSLHLVPTEDEYRVYASNDPSLPVEEHYPLRWGIENLFKTKNGLGPVTSTVHDSFRLLLFVLTLIVASLWKLLIRTRKHTSLRHFKKQVQQMLEEHSFLDQLPTSKKNKATKD
jgi:Transposase DDE domain